MHAAVIGDPQATEVRDIAELLSRVLNTGGTEVVSLAECETLDSNSLDLLVIVAGWPEQFSSGAMVELITRFPLVRLVYVAGPWCVSIGRTRDLWPPALRVPLAQLEGRLRREQAVVAGLAVPLPVTASREEVVKFWLAESQPVDRGDFSACVVSPDPEIRRWLCDAIRPVLRIVDRESTVGSTTDVLVVDLDPWEHVGARFAETAAARPGVPIIGLTGEVSRLEPQALVDRGIQFLMSKQEPLADLQEALFDIASRCATLSVHRSSTFMLRSDR